MSQHIPPSSHVGLTLERHFGGSLGTILKSSWIVDFFHVFPLLSVNYTTNISLPDLWAAIVHQTPLFSEYQAQLFRILWQLSQKIP